MLEIKNIKLKLGQFSLNDIDRRIFCDTGI